MYTNIKNRLIKTVMIVFIPLLDVTFMNAASTDDLFVEALAKRESADYNESRKILESIAKKDPKAKYYLGVLAEDNKAGLKNEQAFTFETDACKQLIKNPTSKLDYIVVASCYSNGVGTTKDENKAIEFRKLGFDTLTSYAAKENLWALYLSAFYYGNGNVVEKDTSKALELYSKSCSLGGARACNEAGRIYENNKDLDTANKLYQKSCDMGYDHGCFNLGYNYSNGIGFSENKKNAVSLYEKGCNLGNAVSCYNLGSIYRFKQLGYERCDLAARSFMKAIINGYSIKNDELNNMLSYLTTCGEKDEYTRLTANYYAQSIHNGFKVNENAAENMIWFLYEFANFDLFKKAFEYNEDQFGSFKNLLFSDSCLNGKSEYVSFFISKGIDINFINEYGSTPLSFAAQHGNVKVGKLLLTNGAKINYNVSFEVLPLVIALNSKQSDFAKWLIENGANIHVKNKNEETILMRAIEYLDDERVDVINLLLKKGADINAVTKDGDTAMEYAIKNEKFLMAKRLKDYRK